MGDGALFGFKDARTARLLPMWHQIFRRPRRSRRGCPVSASARPPWPDRSSSAMVCPTIRVSIAGSPTCSIFTAICGITSFARSNTKTGSTTSPSTCASWRSFSGSPGSKVRGGFACDDVGDHRSRPAARPRQRRGGSPTVRSVALQDGATVRGQSPQSRERIGVLVNEFIIFQQLKQRPLEAQFEGMTAIASGRAARRWPSRRRRQRRSTPWRRSSPRRQRL